MVCGDVKYWNLLQNDRNHTGWQGCGTKSPGENVLRKRILKGSIFVPFGANLTLFGTNSEIPAGGWHRLVTL